MEVLIESSTVEVKAAARCQSDFFFVTDAKKARSFVLANIFQAGLILLVKHATYP
jgi:hypothetical protein